MVWGHLCHSGLAGGPCISQGWSSVWSHLAGGMREGQFRGHSFLMSFAAKKSTIQSQSITDSYHCSFRCSTIFVVYMFFLAKGEHGLQHHPGCFDVDHGQIGILDRCGRTHQTCLGDGIWGSIFFRMGRAQEIKGFCVTHGFCWWSLIWE